MKAEVIACDQDKIKALDQQLFIDGKVQVKPYEFYKTVPDQERRAWAVSRGVYCFPTTELANWIKARIGGRKAIEIGSGNGALGRALGIPMTDSYSQTTPEMKAYFRLLGQEPISPPSDVYEFEANEAVDVLKPQVVVAAYVTQKFLSGDEDQYVGSSIFGVDELALLPKVQTYIFVGSDESHHDKRINKLPHETHRFEWVVTRCGKPEANFIKVWDRP